ncbi:spore gernimation protein GerC [Paenibacillus selenitireducens]|uniref:Spore gernimation protein GerC n=1 Tax=Paenibacillus selenitireducens TaxID=1324314 RepID=A0A1T2X5Z0_9BACL|nr:Ger(x)C family spore germination protein [Paenibacillus selenitireducens]OPA75298.1 spore gernimation protein GerC [Paenibacillus selenitireducens]
MRTWSKLVISLLLCTLLPGCWNSKDLQNMAYVTALGIDYVDNKYITYAQILNFANIAKTETASTGKPVPVWIGRGEGRTVTESLTTIYSTSQMRIFWGHVKAMICTEALMKHGLQEVYDMLNRYREVRYNILIYGTKEPLKDILVQKSMFNLSPLDTVMNQPSQVYSQRSFILPVYGFKVISQLNESGSPAMIPSLAIKRDKWFEDQKEHPMFQIDGAYYFHYQNLSGWLSEDDLKGARWMQKQLQRSPINIPYKGKPVAALIMIKPKYKVTPILEGNRVRYNIMLHMQAYLDEIVKKTPNHEMEKMASEVVENEIRMSYKKGLPMEIDVLKLEEHLYRKYPKKWHEVHRSSGFVLNEDSLKDVRVIVTLLNSGKYKERVE